MQYQHTCTKNANPLFRMPHKDTSTQSRTHNRYPMLTYQCTVYLSYPTENIPLIISVKVQSSLSGVCVENKNSKAVIYKKRRAREGGIIYSLPTFNPTQTDKIGFRETKSGRPSMLSCFATPDFLFLFEAALDVHGG